MKVYILQQTNNTAEDQFLQKQDQKVHTWISFSVS